MTFGTQDWVGMLLYLAVRISMALWLLAALLAALARSRSHRPAAPRARRVEPARDTVQELAITLRAARNSALARERIASRLHLLARDLASLDAGRMEGEIGSHPGGDGPLLTASLKAYFDEHRLAISGGSGQKAQRERAFIAQTAEAVACLEGMCSNLRGEPS
jgi:hypothetical protein